MKAHTSWCTEKNNHLWSVWVFCARHGKNNSHTLASKNCACIGKISQHHIRSWPSTWKITVWHQCYFLSFTYIIRDFVNQPNQPIPFPLTHKNAICGLCEYFCKTWEKQQHLKIVLIIIRDFVNQPNQPLPFPLTHKNTICGLCEYFCKTWEKQQPHTSI